MSNATQRIKKTINGYTVEIEYVTDDSGSRPCATVSQGSFSSSWEVVEDFGGIETYGGVKLMDRIDQLEIQDWLEDQGYFS